MSSLEEFRKKRKDRGTNNASVSADLESFRAIRNQRLKAPTYQNNYYNMPSNASVASPQPSTEPKQTYRYNSIAEYDEALKKAEEGINKGAYNWKNVANAMINSPLSQASSIAKAAATQKYTEAEREYEALKKERNLYKNEHILEEMQNKYANNADFASLSGDLTQDEINSLGSREAVSFFESNTRKMKPEEKAIANYIFRTEGTEGLKSYFGEIMPSVNKRSHEARMEEQNKWLDEGVNTDQIENALGPALGKAVSYAVNKDNFYRNAAASLGTTPANIIGGVGAIGEFIDSKAHGRDYDPYSGAAGLASWAEDTREDVSENITDSTGSQYVLPFFYNTGMSVLDSTAGALTMGDAYSVLMGGTAFNSTYRDVVDRGGSESDAIWTAFAAGIFEGLFEKVSLDNVLKAKDVTGWKSWIRETLKQGGIEASEEVTTEIANIFTDQLINGINSDVQIKIDELRDQGYSETEIASMVAKDLAMQIGEAGLGGFVSGLMMGGTFNSMQYHQLSDMGDYVDRNKLSGIDFSDNENAQSLSKKYGDEWTAKAKSAEIGATYREQLSKSEKGLEKAQLDSATDAIAKTYDISQKEAAEFAKAVMTDEVDRTLKQRNMLKTDLGDDILDDYQNNRGWYGFDENGRLKNDFSKASNAFEQYSKVVNARKSDTQVSAEKASKALKIGQTNMVKGEEADIISMSQNKDGSYTVKTSKGNYKASDVTVNEKTATALSWSANISNEALKEAYVKNFSGGDINDYDMYARFLFEWGKMGADWSMYYDNVTSVMPKERAEQLYEAGMEFDKKDLKFTQAAFDIAVAEMKSSKTKKGDFAGGTYENGNFTKDDDFYRNLSRTKKRLYLICKAFADFAGINVQVINDEDVASENGHFVVDRPDGGTVMINLAARPYADSAYGMHSYVIDTLSHELTHWMRANNEEGYKILEKAISEHLKSKGVYDDLIKNEIESHKKAHPGEKELDELDALEEVIARGCEDMLEDSKTMREVLSTLDVNSLEKLRIAFDKWFDRVETFLDKLMSGFESPNEVIKYLRDEYKSFRKLWVEGIQGAIKNAQTQTTDVRSRQMNSDKLSEKTVGNENGTLVDEEGNIHGWYRIPYQWCQDAFNVLNTDPILQKVADKVFKTFDTIQKNNARYSDEYPVSFLSTEFYKKHTYLHNTVGVFSNDRIFKGEHYGIYYNIDELNKLSNQRKAEIILHEIIHACTADSIKVAEDFRKENLIDENNKLISIDEVIKKAQNNRIKAGLILIDTYNSLSRNKSENDDYYGLTDAMEMVAELSNPEFRSYLKKKSLWGRIVDAFKTLFGLRKDSANALDVVSRAMNLIMDDINGEVKVKRSTKLTDERQQNSLNKVVNKVGIEVQDSYAYPKYSDKTWRASEYVTDKTAAIKALAKSMDITEKEAEQYIDDIGSIANQIANDPDRLDYISIEGKSAWVSNPEYGGSLDYSFLCPKRLTYTGTMNAILAKQNDLIFSVDDFLFLRRALISAGYEAPCSFCFVESARARFGKYNQQFLDLAKEEKLAYIPTAEELSNPDKLEEMRSAHPETFKRYEKFLNSLSQRKPKMLEERRPYNGDILKAFQGKEHTIIEKNLHGGIRFNSFSDFETVHMIDCMQAIMDMSRVGLAGFGYTKQKAFAEIFGKTGLKIDMSCVAKGVMQDGKHIIFDDVEGMNHKDALKLRNGNVGIVCVVFTDDQLRAALCDERIDYVLPFHRSQWSKKDYEKMGLSLDTKDFTRLQTEKFGTKKAKEGNIPFLSYWNEKQTGEETVQRYLDIINEQNKTPIFPFILEKDEKGNWIMPKGKRDHNGKLLNKKEEIKELAAKNYWKLLTEYKMYDNDGTPIGQYPVKPIFDMDAAHKLLKKYDGSHKEFPVSNEVVEDFMNYKKTGESKLLPEWKKYSDKLDSEGRVLTEGQQNYFIRSKARDAQGRLLVAYHGTPNAQFTAFERSYLGNAYFFTDDRFVAYGYSGTQKDVNPYEVAPIKTFKDLKSRLEPLGYEVSKEDGNIVIFDGRKSYKKKTVKDALEYFIAFLEPDAFGGAFEVYLNAENPLNIDAKGANFNSIESGLFDDEGNEITNTDGLVSYAQSHGYDSIIVDNVFDNGQYDDLDQESRVIVVFNPDQIKSIYNENPTNNHDIRYSDKLDSTYMDAVESGNLTLAQQMVDQAAKGAGYTIKGYHGTFADFTEFDLNKANEDSFMGRGFYFTSNENEAKNTYASFKGGDVQNKIDQMAAELLEQWGYGWDAVQEFPDEYNHKLMKYTNDDSYWKEVSDKESDRLYNKAVKEVKESLTGKGKVMPVYLKLENPYIIAENDTRNPYEISQEVNKGNYDGIIDYSMAKRKNLEKGTIHYVVLKPNQVKSANTVVYDENKNIIPLSERFNANNNDIRYSEKLDLTNASPEVRERVKELEKQVGKLTKENDALKAAKTMAAEKAQKEALTGKIIEQSKTLGKWLLTDPKANPVPQVLRKPIISLLRSIDYTTSSFAWRKAHEFEYTKKDQSMAVMMGRINHMLKDIDQDEVNNPEAYDMSQLDWLPAFTKEFDQITNAVNEAEKASGDRFNLQQMSVEDLEKLNKLITALKTSVHNMNKVFGEHNKESVSDLGKEIITYLDEVGQKNIDNGLTQFLEIDNTTPFYFFKRLGPAGQKLFRTLMDAQGNYAFKAKEIETYAKSVFKGKDVSKWREQIKEFDITEVKYGGSSIAETEKTHIKMTVPQIMSLYCLAKRDQALKHLSSGGMKISTFKEGKNDVRQLNNVTLSESDLNMITSTLTDEQREVADKLQDFLSTTCSTWGNEVTMQRFGYKAFTEKNYFPIVVDTNVLNKEARQKGSSIYQLLNMGFTKPLNPKAKNPIEIFDIFEVFTTHATDMAQYNTFALPILNVIRVWNYKEVETLEAADEGEWSATRENTERDTGEANEIEKQRYITVKTSIEKTLGAMGNRYIGRLLADLNGDVTGGRADRLDKFTKNYKTAAVAANIQVALLQPLSYIRADYVIDAKYLTKAVGMKSDPELIKKYCGMAVWKSMGFYNLAINNGLAHKIMQDDSTKDKIIDKTLWLAGKMDELSWQKLWNACELEVKDKTDLKGEEFYKAVGERLTEVIFATQVVDSILTKSELMRGTDTYTKMLTAFNAEPTLGLNILMDAAEMFDQERRAHGTQSALRKHGATMKKAATVYLMGSLAESVLRAVWGRIRNYDGEDDDETLIHEIITRFLEELNPLRKIPFVKDLYGILVQTISVFAGDQYKIYADTRMDEASIEALANAIVQVPKVIKKQEITYKDINKIAKGIDATGLPVSSTIRIFKGIWNNTIGRIWESALIK